VAKNFGIARIILLLMLGALVILIFMPAIGLWSGSPGSAGAVYFLFSPFCHQLGPRSLQLAGLPLAVCARCAGVYFGLFTGAAFFTFLSRRPSRMIFPAMILIATDGMLNALSIIDTPAAARFLIGLAFGFFSGGLLGSGVFDLEKMLGKHEEGKWKTGDTI